MTMAHAEQAQLALEENLHEDTAHGYPGHDVVAAAFASQGATLLRALKCARGSYDKKLGWARSCLGVV